MEIAELIDHTLLKPHTTKEEIRVLCEEAKKYNFASVCVNPYHVLWASSILIGTKVKVCTVIGFPLGANTRSIKVQEAEKAVLEGAKELDMVINLGALKEQNYSLVAQDIKGVVQASQGKALVKVIMETCYLTEEEKIKICLIAQEEGADFVKTSTGFGLGGAIVEDVALLRKTVGPKMGVKASGGIKDLATAKDMLAAGANRLGTSSGVKIIQELIDKKESCLPSN